MDWLPLLQEYDFWIESAYTVIVVLLCGLVAFRLHGLYSLSSHKGLKYFRNTFLYFGISWLIRYLMYGLGRYPGFVYPFFAFFICLAGFYLLRSVLWRRVSEHWWFFMYVAAFWIAVLDSLFGFMYFMYYSQLAVFTYGILLFKQRYDFSKKSIGQLPLLTMIFFFLGWLINFLTYVLQGAFPLLPYYAYGLTTFIFLLLFLGMRRFGDG
jgi:hypothetical protein